MSISAKTKRMLLSKSGGYCQNPNCNTDLYKVFTSGETSNIQELAHIIAQQDNGPRGDNSLSSKDEFDNIILLCSNCHTTIDKNPEEYSVQTLKTWKNEHIEKINSLFVIPKFSNRNDLKNEIDQLLVENNFIFDKYGPFSDFAEQNCQTDASQMWEKNTLEVIIPNNRKILNLLSNNLNLLDSSEKLIYFKFKDHKEGFEYNKLSNDKNSSVALFPKEICSILNN